MLADSPNDRTEIPTIAAVPAPLPCLDCPEKSSTEQLHTFRRKPGPQKTVEMSREIFRFPDTVLALGLGSNAVFPVCHVIF